ncbi:MAG: (Fe-S)-binding protein [Bacteroidales bacterium]|nr:(Fe-S)-binding protein [Bacteroidales bacterium]
MTERFLSAYNSFVLPFLFGMGFVILYCIIAAIRIWFQLTTEDKKKFMLSLVNPKIMLKNVRDLFCDCLFHVKLWKRNKLLGYMHSSIAFGWFMLIVVGHIECFCYFPGRLKTFYYPIFFRFFVAESQSTMQGSFFFFLMDFFLLMVLSGIVLAIIKRIRSRFFGMRRTTNLSLTDLIGLYSLWAIFPLRLLAEGFTADIAGGSFLTKSLNILFHNFLGNHLNMLPTWWAYSIALGIFMVMLPFTRYMHIPSEIMLIPLRNAGIQISNPRKGIAKVMVYTCPSCGVCIDACPMGITKRNNRDATVYLNRQLKRRNEGRIEEISDKCLLCGKCGAVCQVQIPGDKLRIAQRSLRRYDVTPDYSTIDAAPLTPAAEGKVLYFAGCMTALTPAISKSMESILRKAGVDYEFMDRDGGLCCGRPLWMAGRLEEAKQLIAKNEELIAGSGASTLLVSCPICYRVFKERYNLGSIRVVHHSVYINELAAQGKLTLENGGQLSYVYHDPCELGRGCGIYEQPRELLSKVGRLVEADKSHDESICCGGSIGSLTLGFDKRQAMTENALRNLTSGNPDGIVTACPLCRSTFARYADRPVEDIAEIVDKKMV